MEYVDANAQVISRTAQWHTIMTTTHDTQPDSKSANDPDFKHINSILEDEKPGQLEGQMDGERDYTGTAKKTDPAEIKLVKKLDLWIMVSPDSRLSTDMTELLTKMNSLVSASCTFSTTSIETPLLKPV